MATKRKPAKKLTKAQARMDLLVELKSTQIVLGVLAGQTKNKGHQVELEHLRRNMVKAIRLLHIVAPK